MTTLSSFLDKKRCAPLLRNDIKMFQGIDFKMKYHFIKPKHILFLSSLSRNETKFLCKENPSAWDYLWIILDCLEGGLLLITVLVMVCRHFCEGMLNSKWNVLQRQNTEYWSGMVFKTICTHFSWDISILVKSAF